jgi:putative redox protein
MSTEWKEITADWQGDFTFIGKNPAGGSVQMGELNGKPGVGPMELLLAGVAGCTGHDVVSILKKKKQLLKDFQVIVRGKRADDYPMVYTEIEIEYLLWGEGLSPKAIEQAIQLSEDKYCSASAMLAKTAKISSSYIIMDPVEAGSL